MTKRKKLPSNARRWLSALVVHLRKDSTAAHFNLESWYGNALGRRGRDNQASLRRIANEDKAGDCGATACAIGWLPALFPRSFEWTKSSVIHRASRVWLTSGNCSGDIFGIHWEEFNRLFMPHYYPAENRSSKDVADRIDSLLKRYA